MRREDVEAGIAAALGGDREGTEAFLAAARAEEDERLRHQDPAEWFRKRLDTSRWPWPMRVEELLVTPFRFQRRILFEVVFGASPALGGTEQIARVQFTVAPDHCSAEAMLSGAEEHAERLWYYVFRELTRRRGVDGKVLP